MTKAWIHLLSAFLLLALTACATTERFDRASTIAVALAAPDRPPADASRDASRHPADLLAFSRVSPGERVLDVGSGGGYFTRLLSSVVGPRGHVTAHDAPAYANNIAAARTALLSSRPNISGQLTPFESLEGEPASYDLVTIVLMYHDIVRLGDRAAMNRRIFELLKPGGRLLVVDHAAPEGSGLRDTTTLHRIDPTLVRAEMEAAGFQLQNESNVLRNVDDDMTRPAFDPRFRWRTNQFALMFVKPPAQPGPLADVVRWKSVGPFQVDVTLLPRWREAETLGTLRNQMRVVADARLSPEVLSFFHRVPIVIDPSLDSSNAEYTSATGSSVIRAHPGIWPAGRAILLHELLHAYHREVIGQPSPAIDRAFAEATREGTYPADYRGAHFLSNSREYFAVIGEVFLAGRTFRPPFTCENVLRAQPEFIEYLRTLFGAHECKAP